ncbi:MAG: DUF4332 domain-containing protein [Candidatus Thorarchaeota archaeon]|nr:DUF4332 domain-containing protein [Candidatus Thorarchaeota archaeon]
MEIDWEKVKEWTLWHYDDLVRRISIVFEHTFVQEFYNHSMKEAEIYATGLLTFGIGKYKEYLERIRTSIRTLDGIGVRNYIDLIESVRTKEQCEDFLVRTKIPFRELISFLNYLFRWVLPFKIPVREFLDIENETHLEYARKLKEKGIMNNLDVLEYARTRAARIELSNQTGMPLQFLLGLANRADISRLPYIRGKTVTIFCNAGYDSLQKIAEARIDELVDALTNYLESIGSKFSKSFIEPDGAIAQAKILPIVVEQ